MKKESLTPGEMARGRKNYFNFTLINNIVFAFTVGNIITLFTLRLGGNSFVVGLISSFVYISYLFLVVGKKIIPKMGATRMLRVFYLIRCLSLTPVFVIPLLTFAELYGAALFLLGLSTFVYHIARGIHLTSDTPMLAELGGKKERGAFLGKLLFGAYIISMGTGVLMYFLLGEDASVHKYVIIIALGVAAGLGATYFLHQIPELKAVSEGFSEPLFRTLSSGLKRPNFRKYFFALFLGFLASSMFTPFLVVYFKKVYLLMDNKIILFTVMGNLGSLLMAAISGYTTDKLGAKPLYFSFTGVLIFTLVPIIISPTVTHPLFLVIFPGIIYFFQMMGNTGTISSGRTYLLSIVNSKEQLNMGIIFFLTAGVSGALGSLFGGAILQKLLDIPGILETDAFRLFFGLLLLIYVVMLFLIYSLDNTSPYSIRSALTYILSPRDLKSLALVRKFGKTTSADEDRIVIQALQDAPSKLTSEEIVSKLKSPRFMVRTKALQAFFQLPLDDQIKQALISDVKNHPYTTAYIAAEIIGERNIKEGTKVLRSALSSKDYFLAGKCMVSLAQLGDNESLPKIEKILTRTKNPRLILHAARAIEIFGKPEAVPLLLAKMETKTAPFLRDEIILSIAGTYGWGEQFYKIYESFLEKAGDGVARLKDIILEGNRDGNSRSITKPGKRKGLRKSKKQKGEALAPARKELLVKMIDSLMENEEAFQETVLSILEELKIPMGEKYTEAYFMEAVKNPLLLKLERVRFLTAAVIVFTAVNTTA